MYGTYLSEKKKLISELDALFYFFCILAEKLAAEHTELLLQMTFAVPLVICLSSLMYLVCPKCRNNSLTEKPDANAAHEDGAVSAANSKILHTNCRLAAIVLCFIILLSVFCIAYVVIILKTVPTVVDREFGQ